VGCHILTIMCLWISMLETSVNMNLVGQKLQKCARIQYVVLPCASWKVGQFATPLRAPPWAAKDILAVPSTHVLDCDPWLQFYIIESRVPKLWEHIFLKVDDSIPIKISHNVKMSALAYHLNNLCSKPLTSLSTLSVNCILCGIYYIKIVT
jgi:hypothetical protein